MIIGISVTSILTFLIAFWAVKVVPASVRAINTAVGAMRNISDSTLDDDAKEMATQKAALSLLGSVFSIGVRFTLAVGAAALPIFGADALGMASARETIEFLSRWDVIASSSVVIVVLYLAGRRLWMTK